MSFDAFGDVNYLAVIVAAIAYFALGAIWYIPPVMGRAWQASNPIRWCSSAHSSHTSPPGSRPPC
jgi:hypothetical protein